MAKDDKKPNTIIGLTNDEFQASRFAWLNGEYSGERGFSEWLATFRQAKIAEKQIEAAQKQIEAADKLFELEQLKQQASPQRTEPAAKPKHPHRWIEADLKRMKENGETRGRTKIDIARVIANRMAQAVKRDEVKRALTAGTIKNLTAKLLP